MAAALKFNPLSCHSQLADKLGLREGSARDSYEGARRLGRWVRTWLTSDHRCTHEHAHRHSLVGNKCVRCERQMGSDEPKDPIHRESKDDNGEKITAGTSAHMQKREHAHVQLCTKTQF